MDKPTLKNIGIFIGCLVLCQAAGGIGTIATIPNIPTWYASLHKPFYQPPNWLFGPVWSILYTLMAISLYMVIRSTHPDRKKAIWIFLVQLLLNAAWSFLFFQYHLVSVSLIEILLLLASLLYFVKVTWPVSPTAAKCFMPYILWVSFAALLNAGVLYLN